MSNKVALRRSEWPTGAPLAPPSVPVLSADLGPPLAVFEPSIAVAPPAPPAAPSGGRSARVAVRAAGFTHSGAPAPHVPRVWTPPEATEAPSAPPASLVLARAAPAPAPAPAFAPAPVPRISPQAPAAAAAPALDPIATRELQRQSRLRRRPSAVPATTHAEDRLVQQITNAVVAQLRGKS